MNTEINYSKERSDKQAFLIMAHNDPDILRKLIHSLDYPKFDIYVHVDAKVDIDRFHFEDYTLHHSALYVLDKRRKVYWGDMSIVAATLDMYRAAAPKNYARYITLSGNDYPIKSNKVIFDTLSDTDKEFIMGEPLREREFHKVENYYFFNMPKLHIGGGYINYFAFCALEKVKPSSLTKRTAQYFSLRNGMRLATSA